MAEFFTSDTHFFHERIIKYCNRPFRTVTEMNERIREDWFRKVKPEDKVYHLGDVGFAPIDQLGGFLNTLPGKKYLVPGNHDNPQNLSKYFKLLPQCYELRVPDPEFRHGVRPIILCHYALRVWNKSHHGSWHLYGHSHGTLPDDPNSLSTDVGVDPNEFKLLSVDDLKRIFSRKNPKAKDKLVEM